MSVPPRIRSSEQQPSPARESSVHYPPTQTAPNYVTSTNSAPASRRQSPVNYSQTQVSLNHVTFTGWKNDTYHPPMFPNINGRPATAQPLQSPQARAAFLSLRNLDTDTASTRPQHRPARISSSRPVGAFGQCGNCKSARTGYNWCQYCDIERCQNNFVNWTSGSEEINDFIREAQLKATNVRSILEWIDYNEFTNVKHLANGGNSSVFTAYWPRGPIRAWNTNSDEWERGWVQANPDVIILKRIRNSNKVTIGFLKELGAYHKFSTLVSHVVRCYGISRCPTTNEFIVVTSYAEDGDLRQYISKNFDNFSLQKKIITLRDIASGLVTIHKAGLLHRDLHTGNILRSGTWTMISDLGLCWTNTSVTGNGKTVKGVLPYVAPEVLRGWPYTRASDVYSVGMIMYELWSGRPPFEERSYDIHLAVDICSGIRPGIPSDIPDYYSMIMQACWAEDSSMRPTSRDLEMTFDNWIENIANGKLIFPKTFADKRSGNSTTQEDKSGLYSIPEHSTSQPLPLLSTDQHELLNKLDERREVLYQRCLDYRLIEMAEERYKNQEQVNPMSWTGELKTLADEIFGSSVNTITLNTTPAGSGPRKRANLQKKTLLLKERKPLTKTTGNTNNRKMPLRMRLFTKLTILLHIGAFNIPNI